MNIATKLVEDMKTSMKSGDTVRTGVVRLLRGSLKNEEIKVGHPLSDDEAMSVLTREAKQRRDSIEAYKTASRDDLAQIEEAELVIIAGYLPEPLSEAELRLVVAEVAKGLAATDMKQMGAVIGGVMKQVGARAEGGMVSKLVREHLNGGA